MQAPASVITLSDHGEEAKIERNESPRLKQDVLALSQSGRRRERRFGNVGGRVVHEMLSVLFVAIRG
jgi:hypothetical protein